MNNMYLYEVILYTSGKLNKYIDVESFFSTSDLEHRKEVMEIYGWLEGIDSHIFHKEVDGVTYNIRIFSQEQKSFKLKTNYTEGGMRSMGITSMGYSYEFTTTFIAPKYGHDSAISKMLDFEHVIDHLSY